MRKTSKAEFKRFKKEFVRWMDILSLKGYRIFWFHEPLDGGYARICVDEDGRAANVSYTSEMSKVDTEQSEGPEHHAKHEAIHLLIHKMRWLGEQRWTASGEMIDQDEKIVRVLEKVL